MAEKEQPSAEIPTKKQKGPKTSDMILSAIVHLGDRKGASMAKIKNYIIAHHNIDYSRYRSSFKNFLETAQKQGIIVNTSSRTGLNGYFKIADKKLKAKYGEGIALKKPTPKTLKSPTAAKSNPKPKHQTKSVKIDEENKEQASDPIKVIKANSKKTTAQKTKSKKIDVTLKTDSKKSKKVDGAKKKTEAAKSKTKNTEDGKTKPKKAQDGKIKPKKAPDGKTKPKKPQGEKLEPKKADGSKKKPKNTTPKTKEAVPETN